MGSIAEVQSKSILQFRIQKCICPFLLPSNVLDSHFSKIWAKNYWAYVWQDAKILSSFLKTSTPYDPRNQAAACGIPRADQYSDRPEDVDIESFEEKAMLLAGASDEDINIINRRDEE